MVFHNEDGNPARANIKQALGIEGDENTKYYHGTLNKQRSQLAIRGVLVDGIWTESPKLLSLEQQEVMECNITREEIKRAVWDCGTDKSTGPDGFTFGFYRRFWCVIENDVVEVVNKFFQNATFPKGGNASFIALILKTHDANMVKDFRPITLIGSLYKIIAKILANRLVFVLGDIGCLALSRGSVIVNGSRTSEFQFYKGLKQGDPLSPLLFLLVMKSLHLLVQMVVDVVFMSQLSESNINVIVKVLDCFYRASGLRINMNTSKPMGLSVDNDKVVQVAAKIGLSKFGSRLSKWKMKTLSIGGRMMLIKSVLGSLPIYHMSIYKVPKKVLHQLGSIRCHFFNGTDPLSKKPIWVKWNKVLALKDKGVLGISSFYALNRALLFKWVWRFHTQSSSLWAKVIKRIHDEDGKIGKNISKYQMSIWLDIVRDMESLKYQGMNFVDHIHRKMGNGVDTYFWDDVWKGDITFKNLYPRIYALESIKKISVASKLGQDILGFSLRRAPKGGVEQSQFNALQIIYEGIVLSDSRDRWSWSLEGSGDFLVASVRRVIDEKILPLVSSKTRWVNAVPIKVNIHA
ncbi:hypothetical protein Tco_1021808 [Tanacetum coccineum]